ncbi:MAG: shikimate dehydrogenase [Acidimicrobiales bacterium]
MTLSGATRLAAVIGDPIRHSRSPAIFNAAFAATGLDWAYLAFEVSEGRAGGALDAMRVLGIEGLSVTMPHKTDVARLVDECSPHAARLGAVNCVARHGERLVGHNTDGAGFVASLAADGGFEPAGRRCVVLGGGGAARAVVLALAEADAAEVLVVNRSPDKAQAAAALAGPAGSVAPVDELARHLASADLLVNATSVGMDSTSSPVDDDSLAALAEGALVADLIYLPAVTPLLAAARARGIRTLNGLGMLVHQAAEAFELWTGLVAPVAEMRRAAEGRGEATPQPGD